MTPTYYIVIVAKTIKLYYSMICGGCLGGGAERVALNKNIRGAWSANSQF